MLGAVRLQRSTLINVTCELSEWFGDVSRMRSLSLTDTDRLSRARLNH
jgi:hypothetical protein